MNEALAQRRRRPSTGRAARRILVLAPGPLGERMAGPEIRAWEFARALSVDHRVTVAARGARARSRDGIAIVPATRRRLLREAIRHDAVLAACIPPYLFGLRALRGLMAIADLYDPHELELATLPDARTRRRALRTRRAGQALQLRYADLVVCAARAQREELIRLAGELRCGPTVDPAVVPFGIEEQAGAGDRPATVPAGAGDRLATAVGRPVADAGIHPLRDRFAQIEPSDTIVLWWGSVWRWLDAELAVRAFASLRGRREDLKLVITAGRSPSSGGGAFDTSAEVRELAAALGVLDRTVLFVDDWIPYERRLDHLRDADLGLTLHRDGREARVAARARYMDYLAAGLPCVLGRGDEVADELAAAGCATLVDSPDPARLATILVALADDRQALARARERAHALARQRTWGATGARLRAAVAATDRPRAEPAAALGLAARATAYYALRLGEELRRGG